MTQEHKNKKVVKIGNYLTREFVRKNKGILADVRSAAVIAFQPHLQRSESRDVEHNHDNKDPRP